jgi:hypothetical protein
MTLSSRLSRVSAAVALSLSALPLIVPNAQAQNRPNVVMLMTGPPVRPVIDISCRSISLVVSRSRGHSPDVKERQSDRDACCMRVAVLQQVPDTACRHPGCALQLSGKRDE